MPNSATFSSVLSNSFFCSSTFSIYLFLASSSLSKTSILAWNSWSWFWVKKALVCSYIFSAILTHSWLISFNWSSKACLFWSADSNVINCISGVYFVFWAYICACKIMSLSAVKNCNWLSYFLVSKTSTLISDWILLISVDRKLVSSLAFCLTWWSSSSFLVCAFYIESRSSLYLWNY